MDMTDELEKYLPDDDEDYAKSFRPVVTRIRFDHLPIFVSSIRKSRVKVCCQRVLDGISPFTNLMDCTILTPPLYGSYHIVFVLKFSDGLQWVLKAPVTGYQDHFDKAAARSLTSEALTMQMLKRETTIPVPEVYAFDASLSLHLDGIHQRNAIVPVLVRRQVVKPFSGAASGKVIAESRFRHGAAEQIWLLARWCATL